MRILLVYPPPWKIPAPGQPAAWEDGPPDGYQTGDLDADFYQIPYGLLQLGANALRAGHQVKVLNLSSYSWDKVGAVLDELPADLYGMSCWTANRRGVALVSRAIKLRQPDAHVVVGGPHATPLAKEMLAHHATIDSIATGESDATFLELCTALVEKQPLATIAGLWTRTEDGQIVRGPKRESMKELDDLAPVSAYFSTHIVMTSRGCPWACTFCGAETSWGRGFRSQSNAYVLDGIERMVARLPVKMIQIKDDTFTTNKKRVLELCRSIRERRLGFFWSCDTRVDLLTEELLKEMRLAGCQRLSFGVESGSQRILDAIDKKITPDEIIRSTELAKKVGIKVRYFMMLGNRGETVESFNETLAFLERAQPNEYIFSCLSIYPGTIDFDEAVRQGWLDPEVFFQERFQEFKTPFDADEQTTKLMNEWFATHSGLREVYKPSAADYRAILDYLGDYHAAHMDVAGALLEAGDLEGARHHVERSRDLGTPCPGLALNYLAVIAARSGDYETMMALFSEASKVDPQHYVLIRNINRARAWFKDDGPAKKLPLELEARHDFQLLERTIQPTLPGPLPVDFAAWDLPLVAEAGSHFVKTPDLEGSQHDLGPRQRGKLKVVS